MRTYQGGGKFGPMVRFSLESYPNRLFLIRLTAIGPVSCLSTERVVVR